MDLHLGLDGGGTKTSAVILDQNGREIGRGDGGPCNIATCDDKTLGRSVAESLSSALDAAGLASDTEFASVCAGVAGFTAVGRRKEFLHIMQEAVRANLYLLKPDYAVACWGATEGSPGVVVIAGTGAIVFGRNSSGKSCRVDGRGWLLGDRGGGFDLGKSALEYVLATLDQDHPVDDFTERLLKKIGANSSDGLVEWTYRDFSPGRIASLAECVGMLADAGDTTARMLAGRAVTGLVNSTLLALYRLEFEREDLPIYLLGGLWRSSRYLLDEYGALLERRLMENPIVNKKPELLTEPLHDSAFGAALMALRAAHQG